MTAYQALGGAVCAGALFAAVAMPVAGRAAPVAASAEPARQPAAFAKCAACHAVSQGKPAGIGPNLFGVVGAKAGMRPGFAYSTGLKKTGVTWTRVSLQRYIANPPAVAPGTTMPSVGATPQESAILAQYLATLK